MEVEPMKANIVPFQTDRTSTLLSRSGDEEGQQPAGGRRFIEDKPETCINFGLDLELPHPDTYRPETVDFPSSPSAMMKFRSADDGEEGSRPAGNDSHRFGNEPVTDSEDEQSFRAVIDNHNSVRLRKEESESSDSANVSDNDNVDDEEYFEDFHLPMTHQNSMSTRRSFMRKIKSVVVNEPDADRIEGIVKAGQLNRHGSIRRKIVPQPQDFIESNENESSFSPSSVDVSPVKFTSTPNGTFTDFALTDSSITTIASVLQHHVNGRQPQLATKDSSQQLESIPPAELIPLDEETLAKIKDCLDAEKAKDLYTLGSRLQDLLTPAEIEEIISNSHRYGDVISQDVLLALSESRQDSGNGHDSLRSQRHSSHAFRILENTVLRSSNSADPSSTPPDLIDSNDSRRTDGTRQHEKVKKRISIINDIRTSMDDSEEDEADYPAIPAASPRLASTSVVDNQEEIEVARATASEQDEETPSKSDCPSALGSSEDWIPSEGLNTPDGLDSSSLAERMPKPDLIPEISAQEEKDEERNWRSVVISGLERKIDLKVIEPYKKVLSHGGYQNDDSQTAIIVFSACFLPDRSRVDYDYVMEHLFLYVLTTLDQLVAEDYVLIYFHGATPKNCIPRFSWVKNCYQMIDRRLRKNLKRLYLVHPTLWLKGAVLLCRPFISAKFSRKITYVPNLTSLSSLLPMDHVCIPDRVKQLDFTLMIQELKRRKGIR